MSVVCMCSVSWKMILVMAVILPFKAKPRFNLQPAAWILEAWSYLNFSLDFQHQSDILNTFSPGNCLKGDTVNAEIRSSSVIKIMVYITFVMFFNLSVPLKNVKALLLPDILTQQWVGAYATCSHCCGVWIQFMTFVAYHHLSLSLLPLFPVFALNTLCTL